jgi:hypothetical protein
MVYRSDWLFWEPNETRAKNQRAKCKVLLLLKQVEHRVICNNNNIMIMIIIIIIIIIILTDFIFMTVFPEIFRSSYE